MIYVLVIVLFISSCNKFAEDKLRNSSYKGVIISLYKEEKNHNVGMFSVKENEFCFEVDAFIFHEAFEYAESGDSIIKKKGEMSILIKKSSSNSRLFYYR